MANEADGPLSAIAAEKPCSYEPAVPSRQHIFKVHIFWFLIMDWGEKYVLLAWGIDKYLRMKFNLTEDDNGFVDAYFGPERLIHSTIDFTGLNKLCSELKDSIPFEDSFRSDYLRGQLQSMKTTLRIIAGEDIPYRKGVELLFGFKPKREKLRKISPEDLSSSRRLREANCVPRKEVMAVCEEVLEYCRSITNERLDFLPVPERMRADVNIVTGKPWGAYNWYMGGLRSVVDVNLPANNHVNSPHTYHNLIRTIAHETFPGHLLEYAIKEQELYVNRSIMDASIILTLAPQAVISEGIANNAWRIAFGDERGILEFSNDRFGTHYDVEADAGLANRFGSLSFLNGNAALMYHAEKKPDEEVIDYLAEANGQKRENVSLDFIKHPIWRFYVFNYAYGERLVEGALGDKKALTAIYTRQLTPVTLSRLLDK